MDLIRKNVKLNQPFAGVFLKKDFKLVAMSMKEFCKYYQQYVLCRL